MTFSRTRGHTRPAGRWDCRCSHRPGERGAGTPSTALHRRVPRGAGLGENGLATKAWLDGPDAIAVAPDGRLLIAESGGQRIQAVMP